MHSWLHQYIIYDLFSSINLDCESLWSLDDRELDIPGLTPLVMRMCGNDVGSAGDIDYDLWGFEEELSNMPLTSLVFSVENESIGQSSVQRILHGSQMSGTRGVVH